MQRVKRLMSFVTLCILYIYKPKKLKPMKKNYGPENKGPHDQILVNLFYGIITTALIIIYFLN